MLRHWALKIGLSLIGVAGVAALSVSMVGVSPFPATHLVACFDNVGGLEARDPVTVRGVVVGRVRSVDLDRDYRACAQLAIDPSVVLTDDTAAIILARGILGDRSIDLRPGGSDMQLQSGDEIAYTQSAVVLEDMLGRVIMMLNED